MTTSFVLDTNLFFNMEANLGMGDKTDAVMREMTNRIAIKKQQEWLFYMPPRIVDEISSFFDDLDSEVLNSLIASVAVKSPDLMNMQIPSGIFYKVINEMRVRAYRGMDVGEEEIRNAGRMFMGTEHLDTKRFEMTVGPVVKKFRERYRNATRTGFIDSLADLDVIMLAKETGAAVVTMDEGLTKWARILGVAEMPAEVFGSMMRE